MTETPKSSFPWPTAVIVLCALVAMLIVSLVNPEFGDRDKARKQEINCVNNLKQIGLCFRQWALDNGDQFPFNVSTNEGGTMELCALDSEGVDTSAVWHFQVMSNELNTPVILVCPKDKSRKPVRDFGSLQATNITYRLRSGPTVAPTNESAILVVCLMDGNVLYCDGSVVEAEPRQQGDPLHIQSRHGAQKPPAR